MLREFNKYDWQRVLALPDDRIPQVLILRGTRNLKEHYGILRRNFRNVLELRLPNGIVEDVLVGEYAGSQVAYASVYGPSMASEVTHMFGVMGTKLVVQIGCCGAWANGIRVGDLFVPTRARCGEGAAQYYVGTKATVTPSAEVGDIGDVQGAEGLSVFRGGIYTTAALFAEGFKEIEEWAKDGWDAVDMETATTFAVAEHFDMESASILFVFDNPRQDAEIVMNDAEKDERRKRGNGAMIYWAFRIVRQYLDTQAVGAIGKRARFNSDLV